MPLKKMYGELEQKFPKYTDLRTVKTIETGEPFVALTSSAIRYSTSVDGIEPSTGTEIYVRSSVLQKLEKAQRYLDELNEDIYLEVFYGWRNPAIQRNAFEAMRAQLEKSSAITLDDIHKFIAVPDVAGHPTGGAVDVQLVNEGGIALPMGTEPHEFTMKSYVFSQEISNEAWRNRQTLRSAMVSADFAPFDGEWWHFSYGDKEWAYFWDMPSAIYEQIEEQDLK